MTPPEALQQIRDICDSTRIGGGEKYTAILEIIDSITRTEAESQEGAVGLVLEMADQNISEYEELAKSPEEREHAANLRADLEGVRDLIMAAPALGELIKRIAKGERLTEADARAALSQIVQGKGGMPKKRSHIVRYSVPVFVVIEDERIVRVVVDDEHPQLAEKVPRRIRRILDTTEWPGWQFGW